MSELGLIAGYTVVTKSLLSRSLHYSEEESCERHESPNQLRVTSCNEYYLGKENDEMSEINKIVSLIVKCGKESLRNI